LISLLESFFKDINTVIAASVLRYRKNKSKRKEVTFFIYSRAFDILIKRKLEKNIVTKVLMDTKETVDTPEMDSLNSGDDALTTCMQEMTQWKERYLHVSADLANYKRRVEKDQIQWTTMAQARVLTPLLGIVDNFERAMIDKPDTSDEKVNAWIKGMTMVQNDVQKLLHSFGVKEVPTQGEFDPLYHEALMNVSAENKASGSIVAVLEKGYMIGDTVLRVAKVSIAA
jgi:molecular chaperone GrpE